MCVKNIELFSFCRLRRLNKKKWHIKVNLCFKRFNNLISLMSRMSVWPERSVFINEISLTGIYCSSDLFSSDLAEHKNLPAEAFIFASFLLSIYGFGLSTIHWPLPATTTAYCCCYYYF